MHTFKPNIVWTH